MPMNPKANRNHKMETIQKLMEIAKQMEMEDAQNFKKKKLAPQTPPEKAEGAE
jgi:hypothetical protein